MEKHLEEIEKYQKDLDYEPLEVRLARMNKTLQHDPHDQPPKKKSKKQPSQRQLDRMNRTITPDRSSRKKSNQHKKI